MPAKKHVLILIGGHFANAPRPQKEAGAAREAGFEVSVRGMWHDSLLALEDREIARSLGVDFEPLLDLRSRNARAVFARLMGKASRIWLQLSGRASASSFGLTAPLMLKEAKRLRPDLVMVHSEAGLWAGKELLEKGFRVGVDFEDWFSEDLPASARTDRPVEALKELEHTLLHHSHAAFTTTRSMAGSLAEEAGCERIPLLIPNAFPALTNHHESDRKNRREDTPVRFYWFSQTIGPGRGLESLSEALDSLNGNWELHLRGNLRGYGEWFEKTFSTHPAGKIFLHPPVTNRELPFATAPYDVGLALETPDYPNHDLTASNKIFEYLRCGLAVIATKTKGQSEVLKECPDAGWLVSPRDARELSNAMQECVDHPDRVQSARRASRIASETVWSWEQFSPALKEALLDACS